MSQAPLLQMERVFKSYGATCALRGVDLAVHAGEATALIGENGAGKSTLMKVLSGAESADAGTMTLAGAPYRPAGPQDARKAGVAMIYQELTLAPDLSVEDNVMLGQELTRAGFVRRRAQRERVRAALAKLGHADLPLDRPVRSLTVGLQQIVEIARALVFEARLVVFDEPTSSLTRPDVERLFGTIRRLCEAGMGVAYISHFLEEVRKVCSRYAVLRDGRSVGAGRLADVSEREVVSLMVGRNVEQLFPTVPHEIGEPRLRMEGLSGRTAPCEASAELRRGEIFGLAGLVGSGRTETLRCLFGLDEQSAGLVEIEGRAVVGGPRVKMAHGLGFVSEDRKGEGLALTRSLADNVTYGRLERYRRWGLLQLRRRAGVVEGWLRRMEVKAESAGAAVETLSGGNQQKVALARVLHQEADVLLLDEPTRGIDVGTKAEIYRLMGELAARGKTIVFVSSYLPELLAVCDRIGVMSRGRLREVRATADWNEDRIMACAVGVEEGAD